MCNTWCLNSHSHNFFIHRSIKKRVFFGNKNTEDRGDIWVLVLEQQCRANHMLTIPHILNRKLTMWLSTHLNQTAHWNQCYVWDNHAQQDKHTSTLSSIKIKEPHKKCFLWRHGIHWNKHDTFSQVPPWSHAACPVHYLLCSLRVGLLVGYIWGNIQASG